MRRRTKRTDDQLELPLDRASNSYGSPDAAAALRPPLRLIPVDSRFKAPARRARVLDAGNPRVASRTKQIGYLRSCFGARSRIADRQVCGAPQAGGRRHGGAVFVLLARTGRFREGCGD